MIEIEKPRIERVEVGEGGRYAKFAIEPLERGFGQTLGNSLRRVLLSSLPGVAVSSCKIEGVQHEFSTVPGVKEDVAEIILNLKNISAVLHSDGPKLVTIDASGECEVTAGDIKCDEEVEIVNPDLHIATLNSDAHLQMQITLEKGRGYVVADRNKTPNMPIGVIPVDSIFTPIRKVNYTVENTRVGQITDYDKLTLEVWTDGSIAPDEATSLAAKILNSHLGLDACTGRQAGEGTRDDYRGTGSERARVQLPEACRYKHRGRTGSAQPGGHDEGAQPGQEVA